MRSATVEFSREEECYRAAGRVLAGGERVEIMLAGQWLPGTVRQDVLRPDMWWVEVPTRAPSGPVACVRLVSGLPLRLM